MCGVTESGPEIVTEGTGWHEQLGDTAEIDVSFTATARTRADAVTELGRRVAAAGPALGATTVRHRRLWVQNEWRGSRVAGCRAAEDIGLTLVDVGELENVLSALVGAEPTSLHGPHWVLADPTAAQREAQRKAVVDARERAEGYAAALGGRLGPLRRLSEVPDYGGAPLRTDMATAEVARPDVRDLRLTPEPVRATARCTTSWSLLL